MKKRKERVGGKKIHSVECMEEGIVGSLLEAKIISFSLYPVVPEEKHTN
jgi:hypothetical protein